MTTFSKFQATENKAKRPVKQKGPKVKTLPSAYGEPMVWLTGGALIICILMIIGLFLLILIQGGNTFWPVPIIRVETRDGKIYMGEVTRENLYQPELSEFSPEIQDKIKANDGWATRRMMRTGNYDLTQSHFHWVNNFEIEKETQPKWAIIFERIEWGRFFGFPTALTIDSEVKTTNAEEIWTIFKEKHPEFRERYYRIRDLEKHDIGKVNRILENQRLDMKSVEIRLGKNSPEYQKVRQEYEKTEQWANEEFERLQGIIRELREKNQRYHILVETATGQEKSIPFANIFRAYPANQLNLSDKLGIYASRWGEFLTDDPREANSEGGVYPAIFGTILMTLIMSIAVAPFGVLAALYLREYAKAGPLVSSVRIAVNNLAGVPSIVYGVFGLGFFCYMIGSSIDEMFFYAKLPNPTYGTGGLLWSSLTLALLTLPVVIVATEEALAAVPNSMREGSYACGASKWQTIRRIILPRAMPGIMTGMILAMARGAGEVAPLMLVGAVKFTPELPVDGVFPYLHPERSFMHLGFHIYDLGFHSQDSVAAIPMVYTTTLLLIAIIFALNVIAIWIRSKLRRRFIGSQF